MSKPEIKAAVEALQRIAVAEDVDGQPAQMTSEEQLAVEKAVKMGGEKFHSLDALVNWAEYQTAIDQSRTFTTDIMFEVDGVPMETAQEALRLGAQKLPVKCKFVVRPDYAES